MVQPYHVASNVYDFSLPSGATKHSFRWEAGRITFTTAAAGNPKRVIAQHTFTLGIPTPGAEAVRLAIYMFREATFHTAGPEVVVDRFEYTP